MPNTMATPGKTYAANASLTSMSSFLLEHRASLDSVFRCQRKSFLGASAIDDERRDILAQRRSMLESVSRSSAHQPHVLKIRMPVDQKIAVRRVLVLTHARFHDRSIGQRREAPCQPVPHEGEALG